jgi:hypothetical protein
MRKVIWALVPVMLLVVFGLALSSTGYMKKPRGERDDFEAHLQSVRSGIVDEEWDLARKRLDVAREAWWIVEGRLQLSCQHDELRDVAAALARLEGTILAHDNKAAIAAWVETLEEWDQIGR